MSDAVERALNHLRQRCEQGTANSNLPITLNFHPDLLVAGRLVIESIAEDGSYRSQFETGTSSGGLTAHLGGERWNWESRIFGGAYDDEALWLRPKYGALNYRNDPVGGSRRFGSSHFRLRSNVHKRTSFAYPDSYLEPNDFGVDDFRPLVVLANRNELSLDPWLDNYIEAHVHGPLTIRDDVEALVLDPSFKGTRIEEAALSLGCKLEWHGGFCLSLSHIKECEKYRGREAANAIVELAEGRSVTPALLWHARETTLDYKIAKCIWHCIARFGCPLTNDSFNNHKAEQ